MRKYIRKLIDSISELFKPNKNSNTPTLISYVKHPIATPTEEVISSQPNNATYEKDIEENISPYTEVDQYQIHAQENQTITSPLQIQEKTQAPIYVSLDTILKAKSEYRITKFNNSGDSKSAAGAELPPELPSRRPTIAPKPSGMKSGRGPRFFEKYNRDFETRESFKIPRPSLY